MEITIFTYLIVCPLVFLAGFADSIAGGGGIISLPAYIFAGLPPHMAYGTNKFAMSIGTAVSATKYYLSGNMRIFSALFAVPATFIGSALGAKLALLLDEKYLGYCMMVLLPIIAVFLIKSRKFGEGSPGELLPRTKEYLLSACIGLFVGAYDGFFGPGAGTFYTLLFASVLKYDLLHASGNARALNLASNIGALAMFISEGKVLYAVALPAAACAVLGNFLGARLAIKNGAKFIRPVMAVVVVLLLLKIITDYII